MFGLRFVFLVFVLFESQISAQTVTIQAISNLCLPAQICQENFILCSVGETQVGVCACFSKAIACLSSCDPVCYPKENIEQNCLNQGCSDCGFPNDDPPSRKELGKKGKGALIALCVIVPLCVCVLLFIFFWRRQQSFILLKDNNKA